MIKPNTDDTSREELKKILIETHCWVTDECGNNALDLIDQHTKTMCDKAELNAVARATGLMEYDGRYDLMNDKKVEILIEYHSRVLQQLQSTIKTRQSI